MKAETKTSCSTFSGGRLPPGDHDAAHAVADQIEGRQRLADGAQLASVISSTGV
jgi:hypothetical protein